MHAINQEGFWNSFEYQQFFQYLSQQQSGVKRNDHPRYEATKLNSFNLNDLRVVVQQETPRSDVQAAAFSRIVAYLWDGVRITKVAIQAPNNNLLPQFELILNSIVGRCELFPLREHRDH